MLCVCSFSSPCWLLIDFQRLQSPLRVQFSFTFLGGKCLRCSFSSEFKAFSFIFRLRSRCLNHDNMGQNLGQEFAGCLHENLACKWDSPSPVEIAKKIRRWKGWAWWQSSYRNAFHLSISHFVSWQKCEQTKAGGVEISLNRRKKGSIKVSPPSRKFFTSSFRFYIRECVSMGCVTIAKT